MLLPVSSDALLVFIGLGLYLATCLIARQPLSWAWALLPGVLIAVALEAWEIWDHYGTRDLLRTEPTDILAILLRHSKDVLVTNLAPGLVVLVALALERWAPR